MQPVTDSDRGVQGPDFCLAKSLRPLPVCHDAGLSTNTTVSKHAEKSIGHRSRIISLLQKFFPSWTEKQQKDRCAALLQAAVDDDEGGEHAMQQPCADLVREALKFVDNSEKGYFQDLSEKLEEKHRSDLILKRLTQDASC